MMPNYQSVQLVRGRGGYGFTLSGQAPCCISWIAEGSSAEEIGLRKGDCIFSVNGEKVYDETHEHVVKLIGMSDDVLKLDIQENKGHFSSSEDENLTSPPLYSECHNKRRIMHKPPHRGRSRSGEDSFDFNRTEQVLSELKSGALFQSVLSALDSNSYEVDSSTASSKSSSRGPRAKSKHCQKERSGRSGHNTKSNSNSLQRSKGKEAHQSHKRNTSMPIDSDYKANLNANSSNNVFVQSLVAYLGTVEITVSVPEDIPLASLDAIESCVQQLRREQHIHQRVVLKITQTCVKLFNADGDVIAVYDGQYICFSSACPDDNRFFCIVTAHGSNQVRCHQFMVDPEISAHRHHSEKAKRFGIHCSMDSESGNCIEFPRSPRIILKMVEALFNSQEMKPIVITPSSQSHLIHNGEIGDMSATSATTTDSGVDGLNGFSLRKQKFATNKVKKKESMSNKLSQQNLKQHDLKSSNGSVPDGQVNRYMTTGTGPLPPPMIKIGFGKYKGGAGTLPLQRGSSSASITNPGSQTPDIRQSKRGKKNSKTGEGIFFRVPKRSSSRQLRLNMKNVMSKSSESIPLSESGHLSGASSIESLASNVSLPSYCNGMSSLLHNAENGGRVASWAISFDKLLEDEMGVECFTEFLRKEFSQENILFWLECEKLQKTDSSDAATLKTISGSIYERFLSAQASSPVNIDSKGQRLSEEASLKPPHPIMFEHQQNQIYRLMKLDSYSRFLKSSLYRQCLVCEIERMSLPHEQDVIKESPSEPQIESRHSFSLKHRRFFHRAPKQQKSQGSNDSIHRDSSDTESLASLEITANQEMSVTQQNGVDASLICRLVLWDGSSTAFYAESGKATIREALNTLCERRGVPLSAVDIYYQNEDRALALDQDISVLAGQEVRVERRTLFRLDMLPIGRSVGVKAKPSKAIIEVLKPVVSKYGLQFEKLQTWVSGEKGVLDISQAVNILDSLRICIDYTNLKLQDTKVKHTQKPRKTEHKNRDNYKSNAPASSDTEDLINVMSAAQNSKMHDQRGLLSEMNLELPDFLKTPVPSPTKQLIAVGNNTNNNNNKESLDLLLPKSNNGYPVDVPLSKGGKLSPNPVSSTGNAKARIQKLKHSVDATRIQTPSEKQKRASLDNDASIGDAYDTDTNSTVDDDPFVITKWMQSVSCTPKYPYAPDLETTVTDLQNSQDSGEDGSSNSFCTPHELDPLDSRSSVIHDHRYTKRKVNKGIVV